MTQNNDYLLTYRYINASVEITAMHNVSELFKIDLCDMIRMSSGKPWNLEHVRFDMVDIADDNGVLTVLMESESILVVITLSISDDGLMKAEVEWKNTSGEDIENTMLGLAIPVSAQSIEKVTIPSVCYGEKIDEAGGVLANGGFIAEEHRLSIPAITVEKHKKFGNSLSLFSIPSHQELNDEFDDEWSIGFIREDENYLMVILSGGVMNSGNKDCVNGGPQMLLPYDRGYFTFPSGASVVKSFVVSSWDAIRDSDGIERLINSAYTLFEPKCECSLSYNDFLKFKSVALKNRFIDNEEIAGYIRNLSLATDGSTNASSHYDSISTTWSYNNLLAAWCDALNSLQLMKKDGIMRARRCVDFYIDSSKAKKRGLRYLNYDMENMKWFFSKDSDCISSEEFGVMVSYLADIIILFKNHCLEIPQSWTDALEDCCDFISASRKLAKNGMYPAFWNIDGSVGNEDKSADGVSCVCALARGFIATEEHSYLNFATKLITRYYEKYIIKRKTLVTKKNKNTDEEYRSCDKRALSDFIMSAMALYEATLDEKYVRMAKHAAQEIITFVNFVDYPLKKESKLFKMGFDLTGLAYAGTQSHALCASFPSFELKLIGELTRSDLIYNIGELTLNSTMQLASTGKGEYGLIAVGEHPSLLFSTNWSLNCDEDEWRGGYAEFNDLRALSWAFRQVLKTSNPTAG